MQGREQEEKQRDHSLSADQYHYSTVAAPLTPPLLTNTLPTPSHSFPPSFSPTTEILLHLILPIHGSSLSAARHDPNTAAPRPSSEPGALDSPCSGSEDSSEEYRAAQR
ncbi:hypothetical protein E2C01_030594 [Portunus trituberculatus]|uniref:Uncharacterized protein n=1 Tax=Portunus trituberculatus TaxID=210409 RepID=A0A5B7EQU5_PORTR|nr:hypothetical protein [Portunus trituberculatus]